jgi:hypothetical protein
MDTVMDKEYADEILACLPKERSCYHYFKDYYALQLLGYAVDNGMPIERLRNSPFARLLNKPLLKPVLAACGDGVIHRQYIESQWGSPTLPFLLTVGTWGTKQRDRYYQTSRPGYNLVLRLNFTRDHDRSFRKLFSDYYMDDTLNYYAHPVLAKGERHYFRETLAWARLDIDLEQGQVLIEEIQTDWVREAISSRRHLSHCIDCEKYKYRYVCNQRRSALRYIDDVLMPYAQVWDQAMFSAALFFIRDELGINDIWYHTWECRNALKEISGWCQPPRSLYSKLPRDFCFTETDEQPRMLQNRRTSRRLNKAKTEPSFYRLQLNRESNHA